MTAERPIRIEANSLHHCPFCRDPVQYDGPQHVCLKCLTRHHASCWAESAGCAVFGCGCPEFLIPAGSESNATSTSRRGKLKKARARSIAHLQAEVQRRAKLKRIKAGLIVLVLLVFALSLAAYLYVNPL